MCLLGQHYAAWYIKRLTGCVSRVLSISKVHLHSWWRVGTTQSSNYLPRKKAAARKKVCIWWLCNSGHQNAAVVIIRLCGCVFRSFSISKEHLHSWWRACTTQRLVNIPCWDKAADHGVFCTWISFLRGLQNAAGGNQELSCFAYRALSIRKVHLLSWWGVCTEQSREHLFRDKAAAHKDFCIWSLYN